MSELGVVLAFAIVAASALLLAVFGELAPAGGLTGRGRWLLAAGLGTGIVAFAAKLLLIAIFTVVPASAIRPAIGPALDRSTAAPSLPEARAAPSPDYTWEALPTVVSTPAHDPTTFSSRARIALGKRLFFDRRLSRDGSIACASCHLEDSAGADRERVATGIDGQRGTRNTPTVYNAAFQSRLFWDGRAASLEDQAIGPLLNPIEMGMPSIESVVARVAADATYRAAFAEAFGGGTDAGAVTGERIAAAIAAYERTLITPDSRYDRFVRGDAAALAPAELRGMALFAEVGCVQCHGGANFSAGSLGPPSAALRIFPVFVASLDLALGLVDDPGAGTRASAVWRVPSLRNVALTAPYFHNGSVDRLEDAVRIMARAQLGLHLEEDGVADEPVMWSPAARRTARVTPRTLSARDIREITAFLGALSGEALAAATTRTAVPAPPARR